MSFQPVYTLYLTNSKHFLLTSPFFLCETAIDLCYNNLYNMKKKAPADWLKPRTKKQEKLNKPYLIKPRLPTEQERNELFD